ncbi:MAG: FAD:protein FMN transferase, partial [Flammeovirgaceae bacterium]|nr:FAD:protein FMN transferase [Flammeovirgaceae bacterium]MDW8287960.1 FAD:protein FMN transferase [Flammeovirgaceae bacterium]
MSHRKKNILYTIVLLGLMGVVYLYRQKKEVREVYIQGTTMGTTPYHIKYLDSLNRNFKPEIDKLLQAFNQSLSTYIPTSEISRFNESDSLVYTSRFFYPVLHRSKNVFEQTG